MKSRTGGNGLKMHISPACLRQDQYGRWADRTQWRDSSALKAEKFSYLFYDTNKRRNLNVGGGRPPAGTWEIGRRRRRISEQSLNRLAHGLGEGSQVVSSLEKGDTIKASLISDAFQKCRRNDVQNNRRYWPCVTPTSSTRHSFPPARFIRRWVRWAKTSGLAHISP